MIPCFSSPSPWLSIPEEDGAKRLFSSSTPSTEHGNNDTYSLSVPFTLLPIHPQLHPFLLSSLWIQSHPSLRSREKTWKSNQIHPFLPYPTRLERKTHRSNTALLAFPLPSPTNHSPQTPLTPALLPSNRLLPFSYTLTPPSLIPSPPSLALTTQTRPTSTALSHTQPH